MNDVIEALETTYFVRRILYPKRCELRRVSKIENLKLTDRSLFFLRIKREKREYILVWDLAHSLARKDQSLELYCEQKVPNLL